MLEEEKENRSTSRICSTLKRRTKTTISKTPCSDPKGHLPSRRLLDLPRNLLRNLQLFRIFHRYGQEISSSRTKEDSLLSEFKLEVDQSEPITRPGRSFFLEVYKRQDESRPTKLRNTS